MKTKMKFLGVLILAGFLAGSTVALAQGRGNGRGNNNGNGNGNGRGQDNREWNNHGNHQPQHDNSYRDNDHHEYGRNHNNHWNNHHRRGNDRSRYSSNRYYHRPPHWSSSYRYHQKPRYVYYRDYNVYYDCFRGVYISLSGRNWIYSQQVPMCMNHVNFNRIAYTNLDYYDDDLPGFLGRR